jgi:hypothetical protein
MPILLSGFQWYFTNKKAAGFFACGFYTLLAVKKSANHRRTSAEIKIITEIGCVCGCREKHYTIPFWIE